MLCSVEPALEPPRNAPNRMPVTPRPIAAAITSVRMVPLAPTRVPATTSSTLPSTMPDAATAMPVNALSREITIGTSAPPTGNTSSSPTPRLSTSSTVAQSGLPVAITKPPAVTEAARVAVITQRIPGNTSGRVEINSCSLATVTAEPEKDTAPTSIVNTIARRTQGSSLWPSSSTATSAAAPPPTPLKPPTSCGICVMCTRRAMGTATAEPTAMAARISGMFSSFTDRNTVITARAAPAAPIRLPRRAPLGELRPLSARMKQIAATRYSSAVHSAGRMLTWWSPCCSRSCGCGTSPASGR